MIIYGYYYGNYQFNIIMIVVTFKLIFVRISLKCDEMTQSILDCASPPFI